MTDVDSGERQSSFPFSSLIALLLGVWSAVLIAAGSIGLANDGEVLAHAGLIGSGLCVALFDFLFVHLDDENATMPGDGVVMTALATGMFVGVDYFVLRVWHERSIGDALSSVAFFVVLGALRALLIRLRRRAD
ncbi:hypothetical protein EDF46_0686 [Frondihabitans sp. PhB188]|uniref:hypothetical protein n=1 Tax=Frondihabitans sp. PhB188 TaxID=2485200 RepID=UPI000F4AD28A|nr:hypothetical protein [Frondihabitans sp. PhB188]ROQ41309.1 hypothetical protein EDF46_0686 [Frondihabitans sp. PhB188]